MFYFHILTIFNKLVHSETDPSERAGEKDKDYTYRLYRPGDEEKIVELLISVFEQWPKFDIECSPVDHWRWKYLDNPACIGNSLHAIAEFDDEIVGVTHSMFFNTKVGEGTHFAQKGTDLAINTNHRGKGISTKILDFRRISDPLNHDFLFSLSNNPILVAKNFRRSEKKDPNFETFFPHLPKSMIKITDVGKHYRALDEKDPWRKTLGLHGLKVLNRLANLGSSTANPKDVTFTEITRFDDRINTFYDKVKLNHYFIIEKKAEYLNWRYCDKRGGDFRVWIAEKEDEILGYLVLKLIKLNPDYPEGFIIDLLALKEREDIVDSFVRFAVKYFDEREVNIVWAQIVEGHPYDRIFRRYGLLGTMTKQNLTYRVIRPSADFDKFANATPAMIHYTLGEGDSR